MLDRVRLELANYPRRVLLVVDDVHELVSDGGHAHHRVVYLPSFRRGCRQCSETGRNLQLRVHQLRVAGEVADRRWGTLWLSDVEEANGTGGSPIRPLEQLFGDSRPYSVACDLP